MWSVVSAGIRRVTPRHVDRHRQTHDERHRRDTSRCVSRYNPSLRVFMTIGRLTLTLTETTLPSRHLFSVFLRLSVGRDSHSPIQPVLHVIHFPALRLLTFDT